MKVYNVIWNNSDKSRPLSRSPPSLSLSLPFPPRSLVSHFSLTPRTHPSLSLSPIPQHG